MKQTIKLLFIFLLFQTVSAQNVIVTVQVLPPYPTYLPDYLNNPSKVIFTLTSPVTRDVKLKANITGDNGISIATSASGSAAAPIHLIANQVKMMNGTNFKAYLDVNSVAVAGISKNDLYRGTGIPEGTYTFCLEVLDYTTGQSLSDPAPTGCSNPFQIMQINPPTLIAPTCDQTIVAGNQPQNMIFTWLPAPGVPPGTQYRLKIVELVPNTRNPNEAMSSATTPAFFETATSAFSFFYGPAQPALKDGKKYAWRITAVNPGASGGRSATNFQNNGNSEVCSFLYQKLQATATSGPANYGITLIKPIKGDHINNGYGMEFSWTASQKSVKNYEVQFTNSYTQDEKIKDWTSLPENLFSLKSSFMASTDAGTALSKKLPGSWTNGKGKIAWRIRAYGANEKAVDSSKIEIYELVDAPLAERIKLVSPIQGKKIVAGYGMKFEWESSKKSSVTEYELQFTNSISQSQKITDWNNIPEKLFSSKKNSFYASKKTKDLSIELDNMWTSGTGKIAWRVVGISYGFVVDSSKIETYEIIEDTSDIAKLKGFSIGGYYVQVTQLSNKDQDKLSGSGMMYLWENGKQVKVYFKDLKVRPTSFIPKTQQKLWSAIQGIVDIDIYNQIYGQSYFNLATAAGCDGTFQARLKSMKITANLEGAMDTENTLFKINKDSSHAEGLVTGKWFTNFFIPNGSNWSNNLYEFESAETSVKMTFADKFDGSVNLKSDKIVDGLGNGTISAAFGSGPTDMLLKIKGLTGELDLSGNIVVPNSAPVTSSGDSFTALSIAFKNKKNLNFPATLDNPLKWQMNKDGSVWANVSEMYVHLSGTGEEDSKYKNYPDGINFDKFTMTINLPKKAGAQTATSISLSLNNIYNKGLGYTNNKKSENEVKDAVDIAGFPAKLSKSDFLLNKNKLIFLYIQGNVYVPFINDWSPIGINIDNEKLQDVSIDFDYGKKYFLNKSGGEAYITLSAGRLENSSIVISSTMFISNNDGKGVEFKSLPMCDIFVEPTGAISFNNSFGANSESVCEGTKQWAKYYQFDFHIDRMKIKHSNIKTDAQFMFSGDLVLAPGISTTGKKESGFIYHGKAPDPGTSLPANTNSINGGTINGGNINYSAPTKIPKLKGPGSETDGYDESGIVENTLEWTDDNKAVQGSYEDGGQKFGGGFKVVQNDPTWGDYFELGGSYEAKEPDCKQLEAKFILGKKKAATSYSYWFLSFYQKGIVKIPIVPGIVEANGFGGKSYYHMQVDYDNTGGISKMTPNSGYSLGIAATADVQTAFDNGILVHGKASIVTQFQGWSLDGISYYIKGDALSTSNSNSGMLQARMNGKLNWVDKYIDGKGQIWGGIEKIVCLNEGQANEDAVGFHFGADDFYINVGTAEAPITAEIMCGNGWETGVWFKFSKTDVGFGFSQAYDSGWVGLNLGIASAAGRLTSSMSAGLNVHYSPFQATGTAEFHGRAYGRGCLRWVGCVGGSCGADAALTVSMPNPVVFDGSIRCDVSRWVPDFTLHARWSSNGGFSISL